MIHGCFCRNRLGSTLIARVSKDVLDFLCHISVYNISSLAIFLLHRRPFSLVPILHSPFDLHPPLISFPPTKRKLKPHPLPRQLPINLGIRIQAEIHAPALLLVQHHLQHLTPVFACAGALAHDLNGVDDVFEDGGVHGCQGAAVRPLLRLRCSAAVAAFGAWEDSSRGEEEDVAVGEFLFEFAREAGVVRVWE